MNGKKVFYSELAYVFGMVVLALGTAMMERADFGMSMVVAPAYLVHLRISQAFPAFTFGMAEYCLQAVLLIGIAMITRRRKIKYDSPCTPNFIRRMVRQNEKSWLFRLKGSNGRHLVDIQDGRRWQTLKNGEFRRFFGRHLVDIL